MITSCTKGPGSALLAYKMGVPLVPAAVTGTDQMSRAFSRLRKMKVCVEFGKPFRLPEREGTENKVWLKTATDEIMCHIAAARLSGEVSPLIIRGCRNC